MSVPRVFLAPDLFSARQMAWHVVAAGKIDPLSPPQVLTRNAAFEVWRSLARETAFGAGPQGCVLPRLSTSGSWFARAQSSLSRARALAGVDRLWVLAGLVRSQGDRWPLLRLSDDPAHLGELAGLLAELRRSAQTRFRAEGDRWLEELNEFVRAYDQKLLSLNAFDREAAPALFPLATARDKAWQWPRTLIIDDLLDLSPALQIGLKALAQRAQQVIVVLPAPGGVEDAALQNALTFWGDLGATMETSAPNSSSSRMQLATAICSPQFNAPAPELPQNITLSVAHTPWHELNDIARTIRQRLEAGARPRQFSVVLPRGLDERLLRGAFGAHGVPLDVPPRADTLDSPLVARLLRLLNPPQGGWNVHALHDLFGDGALRFESEGVGFDARRLRRAFNCVRGEDAMAPWRSPEQTAQKWARQVEFWQRPRGRRGDTRRAEIVNESLEGGDLTALEALKARLAPLENRLRAHEWLMLVVDIVDALTNHFGGTELPDGELLPSAIHARQQLHILKAGFEAVAQRAAPTPTALGDEFDDEFSAIPLSDEREVPRAASAWVAWLRLELATATPDETTVRAEWVRVLSLDAAGEAFGGPYNARSEVFVVGLSERAWPLLPARSALFGRAEAALKELRSFAASPLARATHDLGRLVGAQGTLHLSRANWEGDREVEASPLLDDLKALFPRGTRWPTLNGDENSPTRAISQPTSRADWLRAWNFHLEAAPRSLQIAAQMRAQRQEEDAIGIYDGVLGERGAALLRARRPEGAPPPEFSPSALERYAACPISYFFSRVLAVPDESSNGDDLDAAEVGSLIHDVVFEFRRDWAVPLGQSVFEVARENLETITRRRCDDLMLVPILREAEYRRLIGTDKRFGPLLRLLRTECLEAETPHGQGAWNQQLYPLVHLAAGNIMAPGRDPEFWSLHDGQRGLEHRFALKIGEITVAGILDRLDMAPDGSMAAIIDYKTGSPASLPDFSKGDDGLHFQLAIYLLGAQEIFREHPMAPRLAASYLSLRAAAYRGGIGQMETGGKGHKGFRALAPSQWQDWLGDVERRVQQIAGLIESATYNLSLQSEKIAGCEHCGHRAICGQRQSTREARAQNLEGSDLVYLPSRFEWDNKKS